MQLDRGSHRRSSAGFLRKSLWVLMVVALGVAALSALRVGGAPQVEIDPGFAGIGRRTSVGVTATEGGRGLAELRVELVQGDRTEVVAERSYAPRPALAFWGPRTTTDRMGVEVGSEAVEGLRSGEATLRVVAARAGTWLRDPPPTVVERTVPVRLEPPSVMVLSSHHFVRQGGAEAVVYRVGEGTVKDGVEAGERWFPGYPLPGGGPHDRFALFAAPYDLDDAAKIRLVVADDLGNEARVGFVDRFVPVPLRRGTIHLSKEFMERVVPEILSRTPGLEDRGDLLENYLEINRELRKEDRARLRQLAADSRQEFLWSRPFIELPSAEVMSPFAVRRTYLYDGREVDQELHLGFDLASVRRAPVPAANDGVVMVAGFFGIYGNAVVLDHGYGLATLYGHLSSIDVAEGERVKRGQILGRTGRTGLAGGDHLHFATLLQGLPVTPVEWWDGHWIEDRIERKLGDAFPFRP